MRNPTHPPQTEILNERNDVPKKTAGGAERKVGEITDSRASADAVSLAVTYLLGGSSGRGRWARGGEWQGKGRGGGGARATGCEYL